MRRAWILGLIALLPHAVAAQPQAASLTDTQQLGQRLFTQSCAVCHLKPNLNAGLYGPALYKDLIAGQESATSALIANGTDHMPGFRYQFEPRQIDAIVEYLKTVPEPAQAGVPTPAARRGQVD